MNEERTELLQQLKNAMNRRECQMRKAQTLVDDMEAMKKVLQATSLEQRQSLAGEFTNDHGNTFPNSDVASVVISLIEIEQQISSVYKQIQMAGYGDLVRNPL